MKPSYRKEKDNDYMILEAPGKPEGGEYQIRMLYVLTVRHLLPSFLPVKIELRQFSEKMGAIYMAKNDLVTPIYSTISKGLQKES